MLVIRIMLPVMYGVSRLALLTGCGAGFDGLTADGLGFALACETAVLLRRGFERSRSEVAATTAVTDMPAIRPALTG